MSDKYSSRRYAKSWKSLTTGNEFDFKKYTTHETTKDFGPAAGLLSLPKDQYPYTVIYEDIPCKWK